MCGRYALGYKAEKICQMCKYKKKEEKTKTKTTTTPDWIDLFKNKIYKPSYNICPSMLCPVIISSRHLDEIFDTASDVSSTFTDRVIAPMQWGLIPHWYKGDAKTFQFSTINCRNEGIESKASFRNAIRNGRRCVILAQGFYEWEKATKQPYFVYSSQDGSRDLIKMAGLFDIWRDEKEQHYIYTFSVITVDSKETSIDWIHDRMPVVLENDEEVEKWLNYEEYPFETLRDLFKASKSIAYHRVTRDVNNTSNDSIENIKEINKSSEGKKKKQPTLDKFIIRKCSKLDINSPKRRDFARSRSRSPVN